MNASHSDLVACHYCPVGPARLLPLDIRRIRKLWLADVSRDGRIWSEADIQIKTKSRWMARPSYLPYPHFYLDTLRLDWYNMYFDVG